MKKFLVILMSAVLCATVAYSAFAEDAAPAEETTVSTTEATTETTTKSVSDIVGQLENDKTAKEIADKLTAAINSGASKEDIASLVKALGDYVGKAGFQLSDLKDGGAVRDVLDKFLQDSGVDSDKLNKAISESTVAQAVLGIYYKPTTTVPTTSSETPTEPTSEEPVIPDTGYLG
jgi:ABC-type glycerol-3-phosphate transport system substrate-binding protein